MGLDISHFLANGDGQGIPVTLEPVPSAQFVASKLRRWLTTIEHDIIDWDSTFAAHGMVATDYEAGPSMRTMSSSKKRPMEYFTFKKRTSNGAKAEVIVFTNQTESFSERFFRGSDSALKRVVAVTGVPKAQAVYRGDLRMASVAFPAVYPNRIGYQRKSVRDEFYSEFAPLEFVTDVTRVQRIYELTDQSNKQHFKQDFLDNWSDEASFLLIWW